MVPKKGKKLSAVVLEELQKRSNKGLEFAKKTMLTERIEYGRLTEALELYVANWNDFTHPGLFSLACEAVGGDPNHAVSVQAAIAMMAAAFDLHDDIIDESYQKHGVPTVFGKHGRKITLLLGNAFLIKGFTHFCISIEELDLEKLREVVEVLQRSLFELGNAHALELDLRERTNAELGDYMRGVEMKAVSIEGDMRIGAIIGGGTHKEVEALARYGRILGTLAMLREEFIDVFDVEELNQRVSSEYLPIPILYAMQNTESKKEIEKLIANKITNRNVDVLVDTVFGTKNMRNLKKYMGKLVVEAINITSSVRNKDLRYQMQSFASSTLEDI
jgi:geranylgeranyl pyrophosphate synthase